ncbi:PREDICTED: basic proline-rich protein-like [Condylura cristata]|uniref:basic proline-rich protein-like n=1 Tax=Condylura cristata TaxID=143302 RepID=UPI000643DABB|nr:PREDICTED: basic proline-rich protein-like [Condylura cristata]
MRKTRGSRPSHVEQVLYSTPSQRVVTCGQGARGPAGGSRKGAQGGSPVPPTALFTQHQTPFHLVPLTSEEAAPSGARRIHPLQPNGYTQGETETSEVKGAVADHTAAGSNPRLGSGTVVGSRCWSPKASPPPGLGGSPAPTLVRTGSEKEAARPTALGTPPLPLPGGHRGPGSGAAAARPGRGPCVGREGRHRALGGPRGRPPPLPGQSRSWPPLPPLRRPLSRCYPGRLRPLGSSFGTSPRPRPPAPRGGSVPSRSAEPPPGRAPELLSSCRFPLWGPPSHLDAGASPPSVLCRLQQEI